MGFIRLGSRNVWGSFVDGLMIMGRGLWEFFIIPPAIGIVLDVLQPLFMGHSPYPTFAVWGCLVSLGVLGTISLGVTIVDWWKGNLHLAWWN